MQQMRGGNAAKTREDATNAKLVATDARVKSRDVREIITGLGVQQMQGSATNAKTVATDASSATNAETGATNATGCNKCGNECDGRGCNECNDDNDDDDDESNKCSIGGCAQLVPGARLVVTQQTISDGTRALDGGRNLLETGREGPKRVY
jgi:hypothetical protein